MSTAKTEQRRSGFFRPVRETARGYGWRVAVVAAAAVVGGLLLVTANGLGTPAATAVAAPEVPHLWRWELARLPAPAVHTSVKMLVRTRTEPIASGYPLPRRTDPLRDDEGRDRTVAADSHTWERWGFGAAGTKAVAGTVSVQVHDLRQLAVRTEPHPFRLSAAAVFGNVAMRGAAVLPGHSLIEVVEHPADAWEAGELPLVTVTAVDADNLYVHTVLIAAHALERD